MKDNIFTPPPPRREYSFKGCSSHENSVENLREFVRTHIKTITNDTRNIHIVCKECGFQSGYNIDNQLYETMEVGGKAWKQDMKRIDKELNDAGITLGPSTDEL